MAGTPGFSEFTPEDIRWQNNFLYEFMNEIKFNESKHEILLSGSYGSAKSMIAAYLAVYCCLHIPKFQMLICRKALPDLKDTIFKRITDHLRNCPELVEGDHYTVVENTARVRFKNGSTIFSKTWGDKNYKKFRSVDADAAIVEELTENNIEDREAYYEMVDRIGREGKPYPFIISCTNPDAPSHWAYKHFMLSNDPNRHVYYSITTDNPYLPAWYVDSIRSKYSAKECERFLEGKWIELASDTIYYEYDAELNHRDISYKVNPYLPIIMAWDFNIGVGKPLSVAFMQRIGNDPATAEFHIFNEVVIEGLRTRQACEEALGLGLLDHSNKIIVQGDATGSARSTQSDANNYEIIEEFLSNSTNGQGTKINFEIDVNKSNPPVKTRHNKVNGVINNAKQIRRLFTYKDATTAHEGLRLTKLKKGAGYIEDDSMREQHITTAIGYSVCQELDNLEMQGNGRARGI